MKRSSITTLAAFGMLVGTVPVALAQTCSPTGPSANCNCVSTITGPATINGNIVVPSGAVCTLGSDVTVGGNVTVDSGASLVIFPSTSPVKIGRQHSRCYFTWLRRRCDWVFVRAGDHRRQCRD